MTDTEPFWKKTTEDGETVYIVAGDWIENIKELAQVAEQNARWSRRLLIINALLFTLALYTVWRLDQINFVARLLASGVI